MRTYVLLKENEKYQLWEVSTVNNHIFYEVWEKRLYKKDGKYTKAGQIRKPSNEDFGKWAWSFYSLNAVKQSEKQFNLL